MPQGGSDPSSTPPAYIPESPPAPTPAWQTYKNETFGISLEFPSAWYGPDVYEVDNQLRLAVGSSVVYPYGTQPETEQTSAENSYQVVIQYIQNRENRTLEQYRQTQPWFDDYLSLLALKDGESASTARSLTTRVRELKLGEFIGAEFINSLSETAQTELSFSRTAFLYDGQLNVLIVMGSPSNVVVTDSANWRQAFQAIDEANLDDFYHIVESLQIE
jgi:hypothetical protein